VSLAFLIAAAASDPPLGLAAAALVALALPGALLAEQLGWLTAEPESPPSTPTPP
jgi:hypothetical protein